MKTSPAHNCAQSGIPTWTFGDKLRKARDITGLGQKEFAQKIEVTASSLAAYETGRSAPRFNDATSLAKRVQLITGIPYQWFLVEDESRVVGPTGLEPMTSTV